MENWDVIVLGAGAAGMLCAIEAGRRGRRVLVLDHARAAGEKIRISGGGRCNFTNMATAADRFLSGNPRFALSALKRFTPADITARVTAAGISWHEKTLGQLFCDGSAKQVVDLLLRDMAQAGVVLRLGATVGDVAASGQGFTVVTDQGVIGGHSIVVATGGKSIPKMGATGLGYDIARRFGLPVVETRPGLVPLTFAPQELAWMAALSGVSLPVVARAESGPAFPEAALFTHRGLSGPAILQVSSFWREGQSVTLDLAPGRDLLAELKVARRAQGKAALRTALARMLPEKLARHMEAVSGIDQPMGALSDATLARLVETIRGWRLTPVGSEGYRTAEVTLGGVDTEALDARSMAAKAVPGLYFVGEVVDMTGWLGGYNFQWAWSSGWAAGQVA